MSVHSLPSIANERILEIESQFVPLDAIKPVLAQNYLVKGWMTTSALTVLFGASNTGKTFVAVDICFHIASGTPWRGMRVGEGPVIYIAGEGGLGIQNRFSAVKLDRPEFVTAQIHLLPMALDLHGDIDVPALCAALPVDNPALIVIDTLARAMGEGDENTAKDMNRFIASCDLLRKATQAHVMVVHHTGKDQSRGARGSNTLYAATDTEIKITEEGEIVSTKQRDMPYPDTLHFARRSVTLGTDLDGDPVTSAVVDSVDAPKKSRRPLSGRDEVAMQALYDAVRDHGENRSGSMYPLSRNVVHVHKWRDACATHGLASTSDDDPKKKTDAERKAFGCAKDRLMDANAVRIFGDHAWVADADD